MRSESDVNETIREYADMVKRLCLSHLKNYADMEDMFQNIFLKYMTYDGTFASDSHKKAWLIRVCVNACYDYHRTHFWKKSVPLDTFLNMEYRLDEESREVFKEVMALPEKYKDVIYLHYYEGYSAAEIGQILGKKENTIYSLLSRGRSLLKKSLGGGAIE